jgi:hypothetical protein
VPSKTIKRRAVSASVVALLGAAMASQTACGLCGNADVEEYTSPDHSTKVIVFTRECGATPDFSTQASVLPASASLSNDVGNAFIADSNHGGARSGVGLRVRGQSARAVELSHHPEARVFKALSLVNGIDIVHTTWR